MAPSTRRLRVLWSCAQVTHMPPELLSEGQMSKAADVYAMGVMMWEVCCL